MRLIIINYIIGVEMKNIPFIGVGTGIILGVIIGSMIDKIGLCIAIGIIFGAVFGPEDNTDKESIDKKKEE